MADLQQVPTAAPNPAVTSGAHQFMRDRLLTLRAVYGGTETLRACGEEFLPRYAKETPDKYRVRATEARLRRNMFRQAVDRITGRIFEVPVKINPPEGATSVPAQAKVLADDADRRGRSLDRCARLVYKEALKLGMYHVLVDYPVVTAANLAQERALNARPYLVLLEPEQVLRCYVDDDGRTTHLAWVTANREWDAAQNREVEVRRIHEREPGVQRTWVNRPSAPLGTGNVNGPQPQAPNTPAPGWRVESEAKITIPGADPGRIMLHTLYAEREDHMIGRTPLTEVADLTIEHFQIASDYRNALKHNLFPVLTATGVEQKDVGDIVLGPDTVLGSKSEKAKFSMLEHNGIAIKAGYTDLESLEQRAEAYAGRLTKASGDVKATTEALNSAEVSSFAKDMAMSLQDVLQAVLDDCALWAGVETLGRAEVNMDFAVDLPDGDLAALQGMRGTQDISQETLWREMSRRNVLARDFDAVEEKQLLEAEQADSMKREQEAMRFAATLEAPRQPGGANGPPAAGGG